MWVFIVCQGTHSKGKCVFAKNVDQADSGYIQLRISVIRFV